MPTSSEVFDLEKLRGSCSKCDLRQLCLPAGIGGDDLEELDRLVRSRQPFGTGQHIYNIGDPFRNLYVVKEGAAKTWVTGEQGSLQILGFHLPGEILGLDALMEGQHLCTAEALEHSLLCKVPYDRLEDICARVPALRNQFMRLISRETFIDHQHLVMMGSRQAMARLAIFLHSFRQRQLRLGLSGERIVLPMSRTDLANYLGLVTETVSRMFTRMQDNGVIRVRRRAVEVLDPDTLWRMTEEEEEARRHA
jgi:CRP/FNR family transcriptional regulator